MLMYDVNVEEINDDCLDNIYAGFKPDGRGGIVINWNEFVFLDQDEISAELSSIVDYYARVARTIEFLLNAGFEQEGNRPNV